MRKYCIAVLAAVLLLALSAGAKDQPKYKSVEIKHFPNAEGVELPPEFGDFLYAELKTELQKKKIFEQVVGEGEVVDAADAPKSVIVDGKVLEYKKGSLTKQMLIGFGAGRRSLTAHVKAVRRSNNETLLDKDMKVRVPAQFDPKHLARILAKAIAGELKGQLK